MTVSVGYVEDPKGVKDDALVAELRPVIDDIARRLMYTFKRWVEFDDVAQAVWLYYLENRRALDRYQDSNIVRLRLRRAGSQYCQREMSYKLGLDVGAQYDYGPAEVRALVEMTLAGGPQGTEPQATLCGYVDVCRGLAQLDDSERERLVDAYGPSGSPSGSGVERALTSRVVRKLARIMNEAYLQE